MNRNNKDIFENMHEKMTPSREAEEELFARAEAIARGENDPSADTEDFGGIIMNRTVKDSTHETELNTVRTRRGGIIAAAAAIAVVLGIGGYAAFGGGVLPIDEKTNAPAAASQPEEDKAETMLDDGTVTVQTDTDTGAEVQEYKRLTEEEALEKASRLLGIPVSEITVETKLMQTDHGVETYEFGCNISGEPLTLTIPTGCNTVPDEEEDPFMTETAAGQALTDAGIAHDGFELLAVYDYSDTVDGKEHSGWRIQFVAGDKMYFYFIDDKGEIVEKDSKKVSDGNDSRRSVSIADCYGLTAELLGTSEAEIRELDLSCDELEVDHGIECYIFSCEYNGRRYDITIPTGLREETKDEEDPFMTETAAGQALTDAGIPHEGFTALAVCEDKVKRPEKYVHPDGKTEEKDAVYSGWQVIFMAEGKTYSYFISDKGEIIQKETAVTDDHGITQALQNKFYEAEEIQSKGLEIVRIAGEAENDITEWTAPSDTYEPAIREILGEIKTAQDSYIPKEEWRGTPDETKVTYMIIGGKESFEFRVNKDGNTYVNINKGMGLYKLPEETWDKLLPFIKSKPAIDLSLDEITGGTLTTEENISEREAINIVSKFWDFNISGITGTVLDLDYALTGKPVWIITFNTRECDEFNTVYTYCVSADKSDPYLIAADKRDTEI